MKLMIASDIHGSAYFCRALLEAFDQEGADRLLLLGDLLYHGPRNDLPRDYAPKQVIELLNARRDRLLCVRGNCEAEVDQMVLSFPVLSDSCLLYVDGLTLFATHGHVHGETTPPPLPDGGILLCGHTHIPACRTHEGESGRYTYLNPGSVSIPKENSAHGYMILEGGTFTWKDLVTGEVTHQWEI